MTPVVWCYGQIELSYYLPDSITYNKSIPTPKSVIGHEVGEWQVTHDKLVYYFYTLSAASDRVKVEKFGQTYEYRPLLNVIITSEKNHRRLEDIRKEHLKLTDGDTGNDPDIENLPVIIRLGYSVHGNESSGANASMLVAYFLAAAQGDAIEKILDNCVILIDPSLNPDGLQRFSTWVNEHRSQNLNPDPNGREFQESWPNGRTNHYWFDLNRDWLPVQHPESIGRVKLYHEWMPNIQTDHHEMGSNATFFFQPGIPSRKNPLIPIENENLTAKIAQYHAAALDRQKRLYYTRESFDDFYFGKGSTYPDIQGGIGILFEQASSRGHLRETRNGLLSFPFTIKNQFIVSLSTIEAGLNLRNELLSYQRDFFRKAMSGKEDKNRAVVIASPNDPARAALLGQTLLRHQIRMYDLDMDLDQNGKIFPAGGSYVIPLNQPQNLLIKAIFERRTTFEDSLFYDVSAWNFDLSYHVNLAWVDDIRSLRKGDEIHELKLPGGGVSGSGKYAWLIDWGQYYAPAVLSALLNKGIMVRVARKPFTLSSGEKFERGCLLVPAGIQTVSADSLYEILAKYLSKYHVMAKAVNTGLTPDGVDLGSNNFTAVRKPVIAMLTGDGVSGYEAGEVWHLFDQRYDMNVTMVGTGDLDHIKLNRYNVLLVPSGSYGGMNTPAQERIKNWVKDGGTLIAWRDALRFVEKLNIARLKFKKLNPDTVSVVEYADIPEMRGAQKIGGVILSMEIDLTHPLAYGYSSSPIPVFKRGTLALEPSSVSVSNPFHYTKNPLISGYISNKNVRLISDSPAVSISGFGLGRVVCLVDDYNFRGFWFGTNRLFMNGIFFGDQIRTK